MLLNATPVAEIFTQSNEGNISFVNRAGKVYLCCITNDIRDIFDFKSLQMISVVTCFKMPCGSRALLIAENVRTLIKNISTSNGCKVENKSLQGCLISPSGNERIATLYKHSVPRPHEFSRDSEANFSQQQAQMQTRSACSGTLGAYKLLEQSRSQAETNRSPLFNQLILHTLGSTSEEDQEE